MRFAATWLVLVLALGGCMGATAPDPPSWDDAFFDDGVPAGGTGQPGTRDDGDIVVQREGSRWLATQQVRLSGSTGDAVRLDVDLRSFNGEIGVRSGDSYEFVVDAFGRGASEQAARDALAKVVVAFDHDLRGDVLYLSADARRDGRLGINEGAGASIDARIPAGPAVVLHAKTSNGGIDVLDHRGPGALLETSNGPIDYSGSTDLLWMDTSNGPIGIVGHVIEVEVDTSNAAIDGVLAPVASGRHSFDTSNAAIDVHYERSDASGDQQTAYDVRADTSNAGATISLQGGQDVGRQDKDDKHVRSADWDTAAVRITVEADTSNAPVTVTAE